MRLSSIVAGLMLACWTGAWAGQVRADDLFGLSGRVALADALPAEGTRIKLQVDLDRNGKLESFETLSGAVKADGSYQLRYDLDLAKVGLQFVGAATQILATFRQDGFQGLLKDGPLPVVMSFEREGYASVVKRLSSLFDAPGVDVVLAPLSTVNCGDDACLSAGGAVRLSGFARGMKIARAYADAFAPGRDGMRFPGNFVDDQNNLLISSGFAEVNAYDDQGNAVHEVSSPVDVRFEVKPESWSTLPDLTPNSGRIELPMYSFNADKGEWVREGNGALLAADGSPVPEASLSAIHEGTFQGQVFVAFATKHFSSFNCDAPISERACVKGRIVSSANGEALAGVEVTVQGVSYTGSAGRVIAGADGRFASDLMRSEAADQDVDANGKRGETFTARVQVTGATGVLLGAPFETPRASASVRQGNTSCTPSRCACVDLGDIAVDFEPPRLCQVTVHAQAALAPAGTDAGAPFAAGAAVVGARVWGQLTGNVTLARAQVSALCQGQTCESGLVPEDGKLSLAVPVVGKAPELALRASLSVEREGKIHTYQTSTTVAGCAEGQATLAAPVMMMLQHEERETLVSFLGRLQGTTEDTVPEASQLGGCLCGLAAAPTRPWLGLIASLSLLLALCVRRLRRST